MHTPPLQGKAGLRRSGSGSGSGSKIKWLLAQLRQRQTAVVVPLAVAAFVVMIMLTVLLWNLGHLLGPSHSHWWGSSGNVSLISGVPRFVPQIVGVNTGLGSARCPYNLTKSSGDEQAGRGGERGFAGAGVSGGGGNANAGFDARDAPLQLLDITPLFPTAPSTTTRAVVSPANTTASIPSVVMICSVTDALTQGQYKNVETWMKMLPDHAFYFFHLETMRDQLAKWDAASVFHDLLPPELEASFVAGGTGPITAAFDSVGDAARKIQLFQLAFLFVVGGVAIDPSTGPVALFEGFFSPTADALVATVVPRPSGQAGGEGVGVDFSFLVAAPGKGILADVLREILSATHQRVLITDSATAVEAVGGHKTMGGFMINMIAKAVGLTPNELQVGRLRIAGERRFITLLKWSGLRQRSCELEVVVNAVGTPVVVRGYPGWAPEVDALASLARSYELLPSQDGAATLPENEDGPVVRVQDALRGLGASFFGPPGDVVSSCPYNLYNRERGVEVVQPIANLSDRMLLYVPPHTPAEVLPRTRLRIPRKMMQTARSSAVPLGMYHAIHTMIKANPDFEHHYFSDDRAREYIKEKMGDSYLRAFDSLIPGAYKSDLFRYIWLYLNGGVYIDADQIAVTPLSDFLHSGDEFVSAEDPGHLVYNAFIAVTPKHPIMEEVLDDVFRLVSNREYSTEVLDLTGPGALARAFNKIVGTKPVANKRYTSGIRLVQHDKSRTECRIFTVRSHRTVLFLTHYPHFRREMTWYLDQEPYWTLWRERRVYAIPLDDGLPPPPGASPASAALWTKCPFHLTDNAEDEQSGVVVPISHRFVLDVPKNVSATLSASRSEASASAEELAAFEGCAIPKVLMQHFHHSPVPKGMFDAIASTRAHNPGFEHVFFDDVDAREYIVKHFNSSFVGVWDRLLPHELRADFFRYCFLYVNGGVVVDPRLVSLRPLAKLLWASDTFLGTHISENAIDTSFIAATPGHPIIARVLADVVLLVSSADYSYDAHAIAGSGALGRAFIDVIGESPSANGDYARQGVRLMSHMMTQGCAIAELKWHQVYFFYNKYQSHRREMAWFYPQDPYVVMWRERRIFRSADVISSSHPMENDAGAEVLDESNS